MCCRPELRARGGHFAVSGVGAAFSVPAREPRTGTGEGQARLSSIATRENEPHAAPTSRRGNNSLSRLAATRSGMGEGWGRIVPFAAVASGWSCAAEVKAAVDPTAVSQELVE